MALQNYISTINGTFAGVTAIRCLAKGAPAFLQVLSDSLNLNFFL